MDEYIVKNQKKLRFGITTGSCATAAAVAATQKLLLDVCAEKTGVSIQTPKGKTIEIPVYFVSSSEHYCEYMVKKDSGDDPDVTNGAEIHVQVKKIDEKMDVSLVSIFHSTQYFNLFLEGGTGIGRVTKEGLEQAVGQAAINKVPREMIFQAVGNVCDFAEYKEPLLITIIVPKGEELAKKTFNPRLGIEGGISILGTSGIIEPMSERAIVDTIGIEIRQHRKQGNDNLLVTPGNYGQVYASQILQLDLKPSVRCSNYIGETIDFAIAYGIKRFLLVGNIGKLVKLAAGIMNTHSKVADGRAEVFATHLALCGGSKEMVATIFSCINTDEMVKHLEKWDLRDEVMKSICSKIQEHLEYRIKGQMDFGVYVFSEKYGLLGKTEGAETILEAFR